MNWKWCQIILYRLPDYKFCSTDNNDVYFFWHKITNGEWEKITETIELLSSSHYRWPILQAITLLESFEDF